VRRTTSRAVAFVVAVAATVGLSSGIAAAAPGVTPNGFIGACNMVAAWPGEGPGQGVAVQEGGGMEGAMTVNNPNGNLGMFHAVGVSGGLGGYCGP